jgi:signal peptidase II
MARGVTFSRGSGSWAPWLALALAVFLLDQLTKVMILGYYKVGDSTYVTSFFNVVRAHNTGAAFSFLAAASGWQRWLFTAIGIAAAIFIVYLLRSHAGQKLFSFSLACIMGGAVGNVVDRLVHGYVVDFIQVHWHSTYFFPAFNVADSVITIGAVALVLDELIRVRRS